MTDEKKYLPLIAKFLSGNASESEKAALLQWSEANKGNKQFFEEASLLWSLSEDDENLARVDTQVPWERLKAQLPTSHSGGGMGGKVRKLGLWRWVAAASVLPIALASYVLFFSTPRQNHIAATIVETAVGETKEVQLPDGSVVLLNENSTLQYPSDFERREVKLSGEAFFEVTKQNGKPFSIEAGKSRTTVLGTSFNLRAYPMEKEIEVTVLTGKVALVNAQDSLLLLPGEKGRTGYDATSGVVKLNSAQQNEISWKTQSLAFDNNSFREVFKALERHFHIKIHCEDVALLECHYTGQYKNPNLEEILEVMRFSLDLKFEKQDSVYTVTGKGCGS